jgi:cytochrome c553
MIKLVIIMLISVSSVFASTTLEDIKSWMRTQNIQTMEDFIKNLPPVLLSNYTLMHTSKSLHGSSYENPRAILFDEKAHWVVTFNGLESQSSGQMVEIMLYDPMTKTYGFHEIDFSNKVTVNENPNRCLACHGSEPRPIWDQYNQWPGAYGDNDDRFKIDEYEYLKKFIEKAPTHPRYQFLQNLKESYKLSYPRIRGDLTERSMGGHNRSFTMKLYHQRIADLAASLKTFPKYNAVKPLLYYFLNKCYLKTDDHSYGDGSFLQDKTVIPSILDKLMNHEAPQFSYIFGPEHAIDYIFTRLNFKTDEWFFNSRDLKDYRGLKDGSDRAHEAWLAHLLKDDADLKGYFRFKVLDFQSINLTLAEVLDKKKTCELFAKDAVEAINFLNQGTTVGEGPREVGMQEVVTCRGFLNRKCETTYKTLPQVCLQCHTQNQNNLKKIYIPFQNFPSLSSKGDKTLIDKMRRFIDQQNPIMPRRMNGDEELYQSYLDNDYARLKKYLDQLLTKREL